MLKKFFGKKKADEPFVKVSSYEMVGVIIDREPRGYFWRKDGRGVYVACDNSTGHALVETFPSKRLALEWLRARVEDTD